MFMQRLSRRHALIVMAWVALLICLASGSSIHHHKEGVHLLHACQLCSLENISSHGSAISVSSIPVVNQRAEVQAETLQQQLNLICYYTRDIRGSPVIS